MNQQLRTAIKAPAGHQPPGFMLDVLRAHAPALLARHEGVTGMIVNLADVDPGGAAWIRPGEKAADPTRPEYQVVIEVTGGRETLLAVAADLDAFGRDTGAVVASYLETPMPERVDRVRTSGAGRSPGVKYIVLCRFHDDLPASAIKRSWAHHVPLALRVHVGADIYIRYWVERMLSPRAEQVQGVTELHFPTREDMEQRWFAAEEGRQQIVQDIGHFLASGTRLYCSEHVLRI